MAYCRTSPKGVGSLARPDTLTVGRPLPRAVLGITAPEGERRKASCAHTGGRRRPWRCLSSAPTATNETGAIEKSLTSFEPVKNIDNIMEILPHRYPFLLVDRVVELKEGEYIVGYKNVTINDNFFTGHFPDRPIMPGVLQVEAMAQLGGILVLEGASEDARNNFFFGGIDNCKFRKPVLPGDTLMMRVEVTKFNKKFGVLKTSGKAYVGGDLVCEAALTLIMAKSS